MALSGNAIGFRPTGVVWLKSFQRGTYMCIHVHGRPRTLASSAASAMALPCATSTLASTRWGRSGEVKRGLRSIGPRVKNVRVEKLSIAIDQGSPLPGRACSTMQWNPAYLSIVISFELEAGRLTVYSAFQGCVTANTPSAPSNAAESDACSFRSPCTRQHTYGRQSLTGDQAIVINYNVASTGESSGCLTERWS